MKAKIIAGIALALALFCGFLYLSNLRSELVGLRANLAEASQTIVNLRAAGERYEQAIQARDAVDQQFTQELANAKTENDSLRAAVADGRKRLLVKATCPAVRAGASTSSTSGTDAAAAELDSIARQDYFDLRARLITTEKTLAGLQTYVSTVCLKR